MRAESCLSVRPAPHGLEHSFLRKAALVMPERVKAGSLIA